MIHEFQQSLVECRDLYHSSARLCVEQSAHGLTGTPEEFHALMDDLHKGLLIKIYVSIVEADDRWSAGEKRLGRILFDHIWPGGVPGGQLREAASHVFREAASLDWPALVRPFQQMTPLRDRIGQLETIVVRVANLVAKADGDFKAAEGAKLQAIQREIQTQLHQPLHESPTQRNPEPRAQAVQQMQEVSRELREECEFVSDVGEVEQKSREERLDDALAELDGLIGLRQVKDEIHTLTNFLKVQKQRADAGLPTTSLSLHLVFGGNPGTGKTTVARIVGQIYGAMGILDKGHLVESDRSGLVAEYAGQTGPKANAKVDEALDGVLFIDEAYSLVAESGDDPYGKEAVQALLKRMEDDRDRLVVVLAGYPADMERLLRSNPGLSSRFNTKLTFEDYQAGELGRIFGAMCEANHYLVPAATQVRLLLGFKWLYEHRDEHFGNGRLVRNTFETSIRRLANRISSVTPLTKELMTTIEPEDIQLDGVPTDACAAPLGASRFAIACAGCSDMNRIPGEYLGRRVRCKRCDTRFVAAWGEPVASADG